MTKDRAIISEVLFMDYREAFIKLVAYCQREGVLSTTSWKVIEELSDITDTDVADIEEALD